MVLVVILTVRVDASADFHAYERLAARAMARYGGAIERTVAIPPAEGALLRKEIHIVTFPDAGAFQAYGRDPGMRSAAHLKRASVAETEILIGESGPDYLSPGPCASLPA